MIPVTYYVSLALVVFMFGIIGVILNRNLLMILMSIELMLNSVNLIFIAAARYHQNLDGQIATLFVITVAACEAAIGLAMIIAFYRRYGTIQTDFLRILRG